MTTPAIEARDLKVVYKSERRKARTAVDGLSFRVSTGEIVGFIGPNGAGKTSAIKALLDFIPTPKGTCFMSGIPCCVPESRKHVGYMPEISYYPKYLTLSEFLHTCAAVSGVPRAARPEAVRMAVERVGMQSFMKSRLSSFSKGMLQQAGCAQALVHDPSILLLDEPMSGLDPIARMRMRSLLAALRDEGKTILFSSHELSEIEMVADRILLMHCGRLLHEGPVTEMIEGSGSLEHAFLKLLGEELPWAA